MIYHVSKREYTVEYRAAHHMCVVSTCLLALPLSSHDSFKIDEAFLYGLAQQQGHRVWVL